MLDVAYNSCGSCRFFGPLRAVISEPDSIVVEDSDIVEVDGTFVGGCFLNPPNKFIAGDLVVSARPFVRADDWCGSYSAVESVE